MGVAVILCADSSRAQVRQLAPTAPPALRGAVRSESGLPVPNISVLVFPDGPGAPSGSLQRGVTDAAGVFTTAGLPPGSYRVAVAEASALGDWPDAGLLARLTPMSVPLKWPAAEGGVLRLVVSAEPDVRRILTWQLVWSRIETTQQGGQRGAPGGRRGLGIPPAPIPPSGTSSVTGVVTARGVPIAGITVAVLLPRTVSGQREYNRLGEPAITDDNGRYELTGIRARTFAVVAFARDLGAETPLAGAPPAKTLLEALPEEVLATTFYPNNVRAAAARMVVLAGRERREGVDIDMQWFPAARLAGTFMTADGWPPVGLRAVLRPVDPADQLGGLNVRWASVGLDGRFEFPPVPVGEYELAVNGGPAGWARRRVQASTGLGELDIELSAPYTIAGRVEFRSTGRAAQPGDPRKVTIRLMPERLQAGATMSTANANADGGFTLRGAGGGRYRVQATTTEGWVQMSGLLGDIDTLDQAVAVASDRDDALVVMVDAETAVLGRVVDSAGRPVTDGRVVVFPADRAHWSLGNRRVSVLRLTANGTFTVWALPAGEYFAAFIPASVSSPVTHQTLDMLLPDALPFVLAEGQQARITVHAR